MPKDIEQDVQDEVELTDAEVAEIIDAMSDEEYAAFEAELAAEEKSLQDAKLVEDVKSHKREGLSEEAQERVDLISQIVEATVSMTTLELADFTKRVLPLLGKENSVIPDGAASKNKKSIDAKGDAKKAMKEQVDSLFKDDATLTDEFKANASAVFEAAVGVVAKAQVEEALAAAQVAFAEALTAIEEAQAANVSAYIDESINEWIEKNEAQVVSALKVELAENMILDIKKLVSSYGINLDDEDRALMGEMVERIEDLESRLDEAVNHAVEQQEVLIGYRRDELVAEAIKGMNSLQGEKFKKLAEGLVYEDDESFTKKLTEVKATISEGKKPEARKLEMRNAPVLSEDVATGIESEEEITDPRMRRYVEALTRSTRV